MCGREQKFDTVLILGLDKRKKSAQHQNNQPACCISISNLTDQKTKSRKKLFHMNKKENLYVFKKESILPATETTSLFV